MTYDRDAICLQHTGVHTKLKILGHDADSMMKRHTERPITLTSLQLFIYEVQIGKSLQN